MSTNKSNLWLEALKEYNKKEHKGAWCIVKRGTESYDKVKAIMEELKFYGGQMPHRQYNPKYDRVMPNRKTLSDRYNYLKPNDFIASTDDKGRTIYKCPVCDKSWVKRPTQEQIDKHEKLKSHIKDRKTYQYQAYYRWRDADKHND